MSVSEGERRLLADRPAIAYRPIGEQSAERAETGRRGRDASH
ncbi:hypothetical protein ACFQMA_15725 [Halosimplex aquaticum]|uniref:Uncharacterized protein n=1 Tax=Halosimplex aquaticum TaxID=3026162 RepID=A0ABD5Y6A3_9EURY|nr:hypothetical protein [Halosimplex aquaticum]